MQQLALKKDTYSKAEMLSFLEGKISSAKILGSFYFTVFEWHKDSAFILGQIKKLDWQTKLIVRSSTRREDSAEASFAGKFQSVLNISPDEGLRAAVESVISSYGAEYCKADQVLVQPMLEEVKLSGVAFTYEPNLLSPYYVINYTEGDDTAGITSGNAKSQYIYYVVKGNAPRSNANKIIQKIIKLAAELEEILNNSFLDIEFAIDKMGGLYLFQVRPLVLNSRAELIKDKAESNVLEDVKSKILSLSKPHAYLSGKKTVLGVMPDWNPAEIIGIRPKPLALSLYKELITDKTWAYQRDNYGYKNLRSFPLLIDLAGLPYIDVRVSFNSFIPKELDKNLSEKLVNYYLDRLTAEPHLHDKVEFEIVFSCYTFDIDKRIEPLLSYGFSKQETNTIIDSLRSLTNNIIHKEKGLWLKDTQKVQELARRHDKFITIIKWMSLRKFIGF